MKDLIGFNSASERFVGGCIDANWLFPVVFDYDLQSYNYSDCWIDISGSGWSRWLEGIASAW